MSRKYDDFYSFAVACSPARRDCTSNRIDFGKEIYRAFFAADESLLIWADGDAGEKAARYGSAQSGVWVDEKRLDFMPILLKVASGRAQHDPQTVDPPIWFAW